MDLVLTTAQVINPWLFSVKKTENNNNNTNEWTKKKKNKKILKQKQPKKKKNDGHIQCAEKLNQMRQLWNIHEILSVKVFHFLKDDEDKPLQSMYFHQCCVRLQLLKFIKRKMYNLYECLSHSKKKRHQQKKNYSQMNQISYLGVKCWIRWF